MASPCWHKTVQIISNFDNLWATWVHTAMLISVSSSLQPDSSWHWKATNTGLVYHVTRWYSLHLPTEGWPGWVDLDGWLHTTMVWMQTEPAHPSNNQRDPEYVDRDQWFGYQLPLLQLQFLMPTTTNLCFMRTDLKCQAEWHGQCQNEQYVTNCSCNNYQHSWYPWLLLTCNIYTHSII